MHSEVIVPGSARTDAVNRAPVDAMALARALTARVRGDVRFADGDRALYAADASNYRQVPIGVVLPRDVDDVVRTVATARACGAPVLMRGGGTSLAGQCCNVAVVLDATRYFNRVLEVDADHRRARVEAGCVLDDLRIAARPFGLTYGPDPATHDRCTLGGMIGNNSCGVHSVMAEFYGAGPHTAHQVETLEVLLYDGTRLTVGPTNDAELQRITHEGGRRAEIYRALAELRDRYAFEIRRRFTRDLIRRASGFSIDQLLPEHGFNVARALVGTEGTCVAVLQATVTLMQDFPERALLVLGYPDIVAAARDVPRLRELKPLAIEAMDDLLVKDARDNDVHPDALQYLPEGNSFLVVEFGAATLDGAREWAHRAEGQLKRENASQPMKFYDDLVAQRKIWEVREAGLGATAFVPNKPDTWPGWEDSAVPVDRLGDYTRDLRALFQRYDYECSLYGHFGQGLIHCRVPFDLLSEAGLEKYRRFMHEAAHLACDEYGGTLSGEHGDGQARGEYLPIMFGEELMRAFREFHDIWDPEDGMNPNKTIAGYTSTENLRLGVNYAPAHPETYFQFPEDHGDIARATLRCVGVGLCRRHEGGTMCPSYMATREEQHATRGRAHLLFEVLQGRELQQGWRSEAAKESLDLCLACKGCKGDCPVHVDVATLKAEFLSHYYEGRMRPRYAYAFGWIRRWAELAARMPHLANAVTHAPGLARLSKWAMGMAPERTIPRFAPRTFSTWFRARDGSRAPRGDAARRVILWPDTFNDYFLPETLAAAADVLEAAGWQVVLPRAGLCCGRPLYDFGMLDQARRQLRAILRAMRADIAAGTPIVGLEPSCVSVFRDELRGLFPHSEDATRLGKQVFTFGEFLAKELDNGRHLPTLAGEALVHAHCHHRAIMKVQGETRVLDALGLDYSLLESGCCGMAGAFGYERGKYEVSLAIGERVLLPAVRAASDRTFLIADGFSCREQIAQTTPRRALHLAEVVQLALHQDEMVRDGQRPERLAATLHPAGLRHPGPTLAEAALAGGALAAGAVAVHSTRERHEESRPPRE